MEPWCLGKEPLSSYLMGRGALTSKQRPEESDAALAVAGGGGVSQAKDKAKIWGKRELGI